MSQQTDRESIIESLIPKVRNIQTKFGEFLNSEVGNKLTVENDAAKLQAEATYQFVVTLMERAVMQASLSGHDSIEYEDIAAIAHRDPDLSFLKPIIPKSNQ